METEEREQILNNEDEQTAQRRGLATGSNMKETMIILSILSINVLGLCVDMMPVSFVNHEAKLRGLKEYQSGIMMGCYDFGRLIFSPVLCL